MNDEEHSIPVRCPDDVGAARLICASTTVRIAAHRSASLISHNPTRPHPDVEMKLRVCFLSSSNGKHGSTNSINDTGKSAGSFGQNSQMEVFAKNRSCYLVRRPFVAAEGTYVP